MRCRPIGNALAYLVLLRDTEKKVLEECCRQALGLNKITYTFIKNSVPAIAEELTDSTKISQRNEEKNKGAYVMSSASADINRLLAKSQSLVVNRHRREGIMMKKR